MLISNEFMRLILLHDSYPVRDAGSLVRFGLKTEPLRRIVFGALDEGLSQSHKYVRSRRFSPTCFRGRALFAVPRSWEIVPCSGQSRKERPESGTSPRVICYDSEVPLGTDLVPEAGTMHGDASWFSVSNGRFLTRIDGALLGRILDAARADLVAVNAEPDLRGAQERLRLTAEGNVAGFRRLYSDSAELTLPPEDWPHHLFIRTRVLPRLLTGGALPVSFSAVSLRCESEGLEMRAVDVGGDVLDLGTEKGLLGLCCRMLSSDGQVHVNAGDSPLISPRAKLMGAVLLGENVEIGPEAVVVGPVIVARGAKILPGAIISAAIIGEHTIIPEGKLVRNRIVRGPDYDWRRNPQCEAGDPYSMQDTDPWRTAQGAFRNWPWFSYARCFKRIADCVAALMVVILFAPVIPFVALAIKLTSPGPVFYSDKRQGLHGKEFGCLKFRTMVAGADKIQDKLRFVSQVDGPQFKMEDDPRISTVGRFLRETYIDEIPQFFNVLFGQMSVVGPRPSPESENTLCPPWRDARLSVRPGITGLWQLHRTREPMRDFQEWIHYDTMYVRNLSLKTDLVTCWRTAMKLLDNFISQF